MSIDLSCCHLIWKEAERDVKASNCSISLRKQCLLRTEGQTWNELFKAISKLAGGSGFLLSIGHRRLALGKWLALHDCNLNFSQNFFARLQVLSFISLSLDKMKDNLYSCLSGNILFPKNNLSSNDTTLGSWVNGRINWAKWSNREPLAAKLSHYAWVVITGDFLL